MSKESENISNEDVVKSSVDEKNTSSLDTVEDVPLVPMTLMKISSPHFIPV